MLASSLDLLSRTQYQLLCFGAIIGSFIIAGLVVFIWVKFVPKKRKRKHRHRGHGRINPTRAQMGGMPAPKAPADGTNADTRPPKP